MAKITFNITNLREERAPLYRKYSGQLNAQPAHVEINEEAVVSADYNGNMGATPIDAWENRVIWMGVPPSVDGVALAEFLESQETEKLLQRITDGHDIRWDDSSSSVRGSLTEDAKEAMEAMEERLGGLPTLYAFDVEEWLFSQCTVLDHWPDSMSLDEAVRGLVDEADNLKDSFVDGDSDEFREALIGAAYDWMGVQSRRGRLGIVHLEELVRRKKITAEDAEEYCE